MNINKLQNSDDQLNLLAAQRHLYSSAKKVIGMQMMLAGPLAMGATLLGVLYPEFKNYASLWGVTVLALDIALLNSLQKKWRAQAALIQEAFDTKVLDIPWNEIKVGKRPEPELIHEQARKFGSQAQNWEELKNWYPVSVQQLPVRWGSILCQRTNVWWDSTLRRKYANALMTVLVLLAIALIWLAFSRSMGITDFMMTIVIPMAALYKLGVSQFVDHRDAADRLDKLRDHADKLWSDAINGAELDELKMRSRRLQDEIYDGRKRNPPVFDKVFWMFRDAHEQQMNKGASVLIQEAKAKNQSA